MEYLIPVALLGLGVFALIVCLTEYMYGDDQEWIDKDEEK